MQCPGHLFSGNNQSGPKNNYLCLATGRKEVWRQMWVTTFIEINEYVFTVSPFPFTTCVSQLCLKVKQKRNSWKEETERPKTVCCGIKSAEANSIVRGEKDLKSQLGALGFNSWLFPPPDILSTRNCDSDPLFSPNKHTCWPFWLFLIERMFWRHVQLSTLVFFMKCWSGKHGSFWLWAADAVDGWESGDSVDKPSIQINPTSRSTVYG